MRGSTVCNTTFPSMYSETLGLGKVAFIGKWSLYKGQNMHGRVALERWSLLWVEIAGIHAIGTCQSGLNREVVSLWGGILTF